MSNEPDEINSGALATIIVLLALSTLAVALVVTSLVRDETNRLQAEGSLVQDRAFRQLKAEQLAELSRAPAWVDRENAVVSVPIDSAASLVLEAIRANPLALSPGNPPEEEEEKAEEEAKPEEPATGGEGAEASPTDAPTDPVAKDAGVKAQTAPLAPKTPASDPKPVAPKPAAPVVPAPAPGGPTPQ